MQDCALPQRAHLLLPGPVGVGITVILEKIVIQNKLFYSEQNMLKCLRRKAAQELSICEKGPNSAFHKDISFLKLVCAL